MRITLALLILALALPATAGTTYETRYYDVHGRTAAELVRAMDAWGGSFAWALTELRPSALRWYARRTARGYVVDVASIDQHIVQTFPRWPGRDRAPACLRRSWDVAMAALTAHEDRHRAHFATYADRLVAAAKSVPPQPSTAALEGALMRVTAAVNAESAAWHDAFDRQTANGRSDGVILREC